MFAVISRILYPNWLSIAFFTKGWGLFFSEEIYNISVFIGIVFLWHYLIAGFAVTSVLTNIAIAIGTRRYLAGGLCTSSKKLTGQTVIITGANGGIGKETARDMCRRGANVILACRDVRKAEAAKLDIQAEGGSVQVRKLDLSSLQSVRDFASGIISDNIKVHILINNAGVMMCPYMETTEGFEIQMGTNHLGHFLLTNLLLPQMKHGQPARIISLSSLAHIGGKLDLNDLNNKKSYDKIQAYCNSKIANVLFTRQLAKQLSGTNIQVFSVHPGLVYSNLGRYLMPQFVSDYLYCVMQKTTLEGAQTTIYCATDAHQHSEMYFSDCAVGWAASAAKDDVTADKLWKISEKLVDIQK
uniref:Retinol dehydrogenase 12-like n=2 Tax=Hirondellea gigas TaxID=1518452 RepID=A0A2P2HXW6_9CRUS